MTTLRGAHVIITGGSQGIGAAVARQTFALGARVSLVARGADALRGMAKPIDPTVSWQVGDVTDESSLNDAVRALEQRSGPCGVLVCSAGVMLPGRFLEVGFEDFDGQWRVNARSQIGVAGDGGARRRSPGVGRLNRRHHRCTRIYGIRGHQVRDPRTLGLVAL